MFTGLIREVGRVRETRTSATGNTILIEANLCKDIQLGDSVAVNGVCLTAAKLSNSWFQADVMPETWRVSNLFLLKPGDPVNLEPAMMAGERFGGHMVSGHVDGLAKVTGIRREQNAIWFTMQLSTDLVRYLTVKGSVAVNGVSLTIQTMKQNQFSISLIPHTVEETNFQYVKVGSLVNIEVDMMARHLENVVGSSSGITLEFLAKHGYK